MSATPNSAPKTIPTTSITTGAKRSVSRSLSFPRQRARRSPKVLAELDRLAKRFPPGMKYEIAFDTTDAVGESIRDVVSTLGTAIFLVILVIFVFLEDWRSTIIPAVTIPVSLIGTFAFVKLLASPSTRSRCSHHPGHGLVVDDAIVVIENIERHLQEGEHSPSKPPPTP